MTDITKLSIEEAMDLHKELWTNITILIDKPSLPYQDVSELKKEALKPVLEREGFRTKSGELVYPSFYCFLCLYSHLNAKNGFLPCQGSKDGLCHGGGSKCLDGLYKKFINALFGDFNIDKAVKIAKKIADLPLVDFRDENKS